MKMNPITIIFAITGIVIAIGSYMTWFLPEPDQYDDNDTFFRP